MRKPTPTEMAAEHRARQQAHRQARLEEVRRTAAFRTGDTQAVTGRLRLPGEHHGIAPIGAHEDVFRVEESQWLSRPDPLPDGSAGGSG